MNTENPIWALVRETVATPIEGTRKLIGLNWSQNAVLQLLALSVIVQVLSQRLGTFFANAIKGEEITPMLMGANPLIDIIIIGTFSIYVVFGIWGLGLMFGSQASWFDCAHMFSWYNLLLVLVQTAIIPLYALAPSIAVTLTLILVVFIQPYLLVSGIMALHNFSQPLSVLGALILIGIIAALFLLPVLAMFGVELGTLQDV